MEQAAKFAETTQILMNVSEFTDVSQATDTLISAVQAFGYTADTSMEVVDLLNTIGNNYAISTADLAQSLTKSSASLVAAGGDLAEAAALTATANKIVQDADSVGTALKTTSLRLRGTEVSVLEEEGLDSEGAVSSKSKLQSKVKALSGVDILTATGEYKSTYEILRDIAEVWESMNDMDQAALLELISGKRNSSVVAAILQNPEELKAAFEDANNASGSALKENEKYLDSIQGKIDQFTNAVQTLWANTLDSDVVKFFIDLATKLIKIVDTIGPLNVAIVGLVAFLEKKHGVFSNFFNPAKSGAENLTKEIGEAFDAAKVKNSIRGKKGARTKRINQLQADGKTFDEIQADPRVQQYTKEIEEAEQALDEYNATVQQTNATVQQASATTQANTAANQANAASNTASASAESADAAATRASTAAETADTTATTAHTAATWKDVWATLTNKDASLADVAAKIKQILMTKILSMEYVKNAIANGTLTTAQIANMTATQLLALGFKGLAVSIATATKNILLFMTTTPIGWILLAVAAVVALGAAFAAMHKSAAELREELSGLKEEISGVKDEIESLNGELETTQERMAELLAKDSLTFTEQEELENLQKQNDLLEREIYLLEQREKRLQKKAQDTFDDLMEKETKEKDRDGDGEDDVYDKSLDKNIKKYEDAMANYEEAKQALVEAEKSGDEKEIKKAEKKVEKAEKKVEKWQDKVDEELNQYLEDADGIDYESADEQTRKYLDYIYNTEGRYNIARGEYQAKSVEIKRIFNKSTMSDAKDEIDGLVEKLAKNPGDQTIIAQISEQCKLAEKDLKAVGLSVEDATNYFTKLGTSASYNTIDGKVKEIQTATSKMQTLLSDTASADFTGLFNKDGEVLETAIAEYFQGTSEETRAEIARLVKDINDGKISVENALKQFEFFGIQSTINIHIEEVKTNFKDVFVELDDADGLIDTFEELGNAIGSTASALKAFNKAEGEMAKSGRVSIETALQLMEYTDDYGSVLQVVDGKLQLVDNAEEVLIQTRIDAIKTSAQASLADAENAYAKAQLATQTYKDALETDMSASVVASAWEKVLAAAAGLWAGIKSLFTDESWTDAYNRAYNATLSNLTGYETSYDDAGLQALIDAENEAKKSVDAASDRVELANQLTPDTLGSINDADGVDSAEDAANDAFQKDMDYWENRIQANQARADRLQGQIDLLEQKGIKASADYYRDRLALLASEDETDGIDSKMELLKGKLDDVTNRLGEVTYASEEWWDAAHEYNDIVNEIQEIESAIVDLQDAIGEIDLYKFEEFNERISHLTSQLSELRGLLADEDEWFNNQGEWTEDGVATLATYTQELQIYKRALDDAKTELEKYEMAYAGNEAAYAEMGIHSEQEYYERLTAAQDQYSEYLGVIDDTKDAVVDMYEAQIDAVEEYIETLVDAYSDYIDSVKDALSAERDLYEFKKGVQKESKNIAEIERKIASLANSTNASDIATRRKLEAELVEAKETLNDTYYDHAKQSQEDALSAEQAAYEETMNRFVKNLRTGLDSALADMDNFISGVTTMVTLNADVVLDKYKTNNPYLSKELTDPWSAAIAKANKYTGDALALLNGWVDAGGDFNTLNKTIGDELQSPWSAGSGAVDAFKDNVDTQMDNILSKIQSNVQSAKTELSDLYAEITSTAEKTPEINVVNPSKDTDPTPTPTTASTPDPTPAATTTNRWYSYSDASKAGFSNIAGASASEKARVTKQYGTYQNYLDAMYYKYMKKLPDGVKSVPQPVVKTSGTISGYSVSGLGGVHLGADDFDLKIGGTSYKLKTNHDEVSSDTASQLQSVVSNPSNSTVAMLNKQLYVYFGGTKKSWKSILTSGDYSKAVTAWYNALNGYAKGSAGIPEDQLAIVDELGPELMLRANPITGRLDYVTKGTSIVPADITENLMEWGKLSPNMMNVQNATPNINMINNAVIQPRCDFSFDSLVHVDHCDQSTIKDLEKMVDNKIDKFSKDLNYSIKRFAR